MEQKDLNMGYMFFLSLVAAIGGLLFGYDTAVISGTITQVTYQFSLDTLEQGWYVGCALVGSVIGVACAGVLTDRFGRKKVMILSALLFTISGLYCAVATTFSHLVLARIIGGVAIGVVSIVSPLYISEIVAARYRGRLVSLYQLAITVGFLSAYFVNYLLLVYSNHADFQNETLRLIFQTEVWRSMLGMEAIPAILFLIVIFVIPESPRWLIVSNNEDRAYQVLERIYKSAQVIKDQIAQTKSVLIEEKAGSNWRILLQPGIFKAVVIGVSIAMLGQFMGVNAVLYYGPSIFENAGLSGGDSLFYQTLVGLVNVLTSFAALLIIDKVGRKMLVYYGVTGMIVSLVLIGLFFVLGASWHLPNVLLLIFFLAYIFFCAGSISAVIFVFLSEMYPNKARGLAMSIAGMSLWIGTFLVGQLTPWLLANLTPAGTFFLFAVMCIPYMLIVWKLMPETAGKSLEDIERYWKSKT